MRLSRFWAGDLKNWNSGELHALDADESRHLINVLRARPGLEIELLDGAGCTGSAILREQRGQIAWIECRDKIHLERGRQITLCGPAPKGWRLPYLLEKLQELGVASWIPLESARGGPPERLHPEKLRSRLREACKQSGCPWLTDIGSPLGFPALMKREGLVVLEATGATWRDLALPAHDLILAYGPEGGFSPEELELLHGRGVQKLRLGPHVLRMETAAIVGAGLAAANFAG